MSLWSNSLGSNIIVACNVGAVGSVFCYCRYDTAHACLSGQASAVLTHVLCGVMKQTSWMEPLWPVYNGHTELSRVSVDAIWSCIGARLAPGMDPEAMPFNDWTNLFSSEMLSSHAVGMQFRLPTKFWLRIIEYTPWNFYRKLTYFTYIGLICLLIN